MGQEQLKETDGAKSLWCEMTRETAVLMRTEDGGKSVLMNVGLGSLNTDQMRWLEENNFNGNAILVRKAPLEGDADSMSSSTGTIQKYLDESDIPTQRIIKFPSESGSRWELVYKPEEDCIYVSDRKAHNLYKYSGFNAEKSE